MEGAAGEPVAYFFRINKYIISQFDQSGARLLWKKHQVFIEIVGYAKIIVSYFYNYYGGDCMGEIQSPEELMQYISKMNRHNSVLQFSIHGKGRFTLVLQEEDDHSIKADVAINPHLEQMIKEGRKQYKEGLGMSTSELLKSLSTKDFM